MKWSHAMAIAEDETYSGLCIAIASESAAKGQGNPTRIAAQLSGGQPIDMSSDDGLQCIRQLAKSQDSTVVNLLVDVQGDPFKTPPTKTTTGSEGGGGSAGKRGGNFNGGAGRSVRHKNGHSPGKSAGSDNSDNGGNNDGSGVSDNSESHSDSDSDSDSGSDIGSDSDNEGDGNIGGVGKGKGKATTLAEASADAVMKYNADQIIAYAATLATITAGSYLFTRLRKDLTYDFKEMKAVAPKAYTDAPNVLELTQNKRGFAVRCLVCRRAGEQKCEVSLSNKAEHPSRMLRNFKNRHAKTDAHVMNVRAWQGLGRRSVTSTELRKEWCIQSLCGSGSSGPFSPHEGGYVANAGLWEDAGMEFAIDDDGDAVITATHHCRNKGKKYEFSVHPEFSLLRRIRLYCEKTGKLAKEAADKGNGIRRFFSSADSDATAGLVGAVTVALAGRRVLSDAAT